MTKQIDVRGLSCPQPVILARKAIQTGDYPIEVLVDSVASRDNIRRMAEGNRCRVQVETLQDEFVLTINPNG